MKLETKIKKNRYVGVRMSQNDYDALSDLLKMKGCSMTLFFNSCAKDFIKSYKLNNLLKKK